MLAVFARIWQSCIWRSCAAASRRRTVSYSATRCSSFCSRPLSSVSASKSFGVLVSMSNMEVDGSLYGSIIAKIQSFQALCFRIVGVGYQVRVEGHVVLELYFLWRSHYEHSDVSFHLAANLRMLGSHHQIFNPRKAYNVVEPYFDLHSVIC